jgi:hypothetical protein
MIVAKIEDLNFLFVRFMLAFYPLYDLPTPPLGREATREWIFWW